mgnify:CR=1 FL=1
MKKVFYFSLMVMTMFLMTACSSSGPGDAMKKYGNYLIKGDYEKFVDGLAFDESVGENERAKGRACVHAERESFQRI